MSNGKIESGFRGKWEITSTELWNKEDLDLIETAQFRFAGDEGDFLMIAMRGWMDCRYGKREGQAAVEFSWAGEDEGDERSGRGWAVLEADGKLRGRLFIHSGDESGFVAVRAAGKAKSGRPRRSG
jgi:hypothetical protein